MAKNLSFNFVQVSNLINILNDCYKNYYKLEIPETTQNLILRKVIAQYYDHITEYRVVVSGVCPYKILSWSGYILCQELWRFNKRDEAIKILITSILAMEIFLKEQSVIVNKEIQIKAIKMVISELEGKVNIGIGMNGFYMIFRTLSYCSNDTP